MTVTVTPPQTARRLAPWARGISTASALRGGLSLVSLASFGAPALSLGFLVFGLLPAAKIACFVLWRSLNAPLPYYDGALRREKSKRSGGGLRGRA